MISRVEILRKQHDWSRVELAELAGVTESTIIRAERSNPPAVQARSLEKIARALDVPLAELYGPADEAAAAAGTPPADPDVFLISDLARVARSTVRRLRAILKSEPWKLPEQLPSLDKRPRWARVAVERWLEAREADRSKPRSSGGGASGGGRLVGAGRR